jgi:hypothetical protein
MKERKVKPRRKALEGLLLLSMLVLMLLIVGSFLLLKHPAASVLYPLEDGVGVETR